MGGGLEGSEAMTQQPEQDDDNVPTARRYERLTMTYNLNFKGLQIAGVVAMLVGAVAVITYPNLEILGLPAPGIFAAGFTLYVGAKGGELSMRKNNR
jgi:hypothetical protein